MAASGPFFTNNKNHIIIFKNTGIINNNIEINSSIIFIE